MNRAEFISKLLKLDLRLASCALRNDKLTARLKVVCLLRELNIGVSNS